MMRAVRQWLLAAIALLALAAALAVGSLLAFEWTVTLDGQRKALARALSEALGVPVAISGSVRLLTGARAGLEVGRVRIGAAGSSGGWSMAAGRLRLRVHTLALLRRDIRIAEGFAEDVRLCVRDANGLALSSAGGHAAAASTWTLTAIERLQAREVALALGAACEAARPAVVLQAVELSAPQGAPSRLSARGTVAGQSAGVDAQGPTLAALAARLAGQPVELSAGLADATLRVAGRIDLAPLAYDAEVAFQAPRLAALMRFQDVSGSDLGPLSVRAHVAGDGAHLQAQLHEVRLAPVTAAAQAGLDWSRPRAAISVDAAAALAVVQAWRRWLGPILDRGRSSENATPNPIVAALRASDGRFSVRFGQLVAGALGMSGIACEGTWRDGEVSAQARASLQRAPVVATVSADLRHEPPSLSASARAQRVVLPGGLGVAGTVGSIGLAYAGRGEHGAGAAPGSRLVVDARSARLALPWSRGANVPVELSRVRIEWREGRALVGDAAGTVFGTAAKATWEGSDLAALWQGRPWALRARGEFASLRLASEGNLSVHAGRVDADLRIEARADRLDRVVPGNAALAGLPLRAEGSVALQAGDWRVDLQRVALGDTDARVAVAGSRPIGSRPLRIDARFGTLDLAPFVGGPAVAGPAQLMLPQRLVLPAADIALRAARVRLPGASAADAHVEASVRDGRLEQARFGFQLDGAAVRGTSSADLTGTVARVALTAEATGIDQRHLGHALQATGLKLRIGEPSVTAASSGNRPDELVARASAALVVRHAAVTVPERGHAPAMVAEVALATLSAAPGQPTRPALDGSLDGLPARVDAGLPELGPLLRGDAAGFQANGRLDDIDVGVAGPWPLTRPGEHLWHVSVAAPTLASFGRVLGRNLPSTGPVRLQADLSGLGSARSSGAVQLNLGHSRLDARLDQRNTGDAPSWDLDLVSPQLRLEEFAAAGWLDGEERPDVAAPQAKPPAVEGRSQARAYARRILQAARLGLGRLDAHTRMAVQTITAGTSDLGTLHAAAAIDSGRLRIGPLALTGSAGDLHLAAAADFSAQAVPFDLDVDLARFAYGRLVRTLDPRREGQGELSFRAHLTGTGNVDEPLRDLAGRVGLLIVPTVSGDVRLLERWGSGLLANLGSALDSAQSRLNCGVAAFDVARGVAKSEALMLDTTRVRAAGELEVDLPSGQLKGVFASKAKHPELFSAKVPVVVGGTLQAPTIAPATGSLVVSAARYFLFAYAYLFDSVGGTAYPPDSTPDCVAAYRKILE
jgi:uncharacterized protein involved in outer membrane biogenesis